MDDPLSQTVSPVIKPTFAPIAPALEKWAIDPNSNPADVLAALNSKVRDFSKNS